MTKVSTQHISVLLKSCGSITWSILHYVIVNKFDGFFIFHIWYMIKILSIQSKFSASNLDNLTMKLTILNTIRKKSLSIIVH